MWGVRQRSVPGEGGCVAELLADRTSEDSEAPRRAPTAPGPERSGVTSLLVLHKHLFTQYPRGPGNVSGLTSPNPTPAVA